MSTTEERRTHVTVDIHNKRLGLYLEPATEDNTGAVLIRFEPIDGSLGEAQASGILRSGFRLTAINDAAVTHAQFPAIIAALVNSARPVRLTFRDPEVFEFKDRYDFLRTKMHADRETAYFERMRDALAANDAEWMSFLCELGGRKGGGGGSGGATASHGGSNGGGTMMASVAHGVARLMRDANGDVAFPLEPSLRLNAVSPIHARMDGISSTAAEGAGAATSDGTSSIISSSNSSGGHTQGSSAPTGTHAASAASVARHANGDPSGSGSTPAQQTYLRDFGEGREDDTDSDSYSGEEDAQEGGRGGASDVSHRGAALVRQPPTVLPVLVSIYKRCWRPGSIGVASPPGLGAALPGELPPAKQREKLYETLARLVLHGGVPEAYRPTIWYELSGAHAKACLHPPGYYASLLTVPPHPDAVYAISKDVERTFPGHPLFDSRAGLDSLRRLLSAFAVHSPDIGYCQGLNFLAGFLLLRLPEEHAFWVLECVVGEILPPDYYTQALLGVHADQRVLAHLVDEVFPDISGALLKAGISLQVVTVDWFMTLLVTSLPTHTALRLWDALLLLGSEAVFRVILALFFLQGPRILSVAASATSSSVSVTTAAPPPRPIGPAPGGGDPVGGVPTTAARPPSSSLFARTARTLAGMAASPASPPLPQLHPSDRSSAQVEDGGDGGRSSGGGSPPKLRRSSVPLPSHSDSLDSLGGDSPVVIVSGRSASGEMLGGGGGGGALRRGGSVHGSSSGSGHPSGGSEPGSKGSAPRGLRAALGTLFPSLTSYPHHAERPGPDMVAATAQRALTALRLTAAAEAAVAAGSAPSPPAAPTVDAPTAPGLQESPPGPVATGAAHPNDLADSFSGPDHDPSQQQQHTPTGGGLTPSAIAARGGTSRSHASTFPALFSMVKGLPSGAHDAQALFSVAFPLSAAEMKAVATGYAPPVQQVVTQHHRSGTGAAASQPSGPAAGRPGNAPGSSPPLPQHHHQQQQSRQRYCAGVSWPVHLSAPRLARLRGAARAAALAEHDESMAARAALAARRAAASAVAMAVRAAESADPGVGSGAAAMHVKPT